MIEIKAAVALEVVDSADRAQVLAAEVVASAETGTIKNRTISKSMFPTFQKMPMNRPSKTVSTNHVARNISKSLETHQNSVSSNSLHRRSLIKRYKPALKSMVKSFEPNLQDNVR